MSENPTAGTQPMRAHIAEELRAILGRRRITASELARRMNVSQPYISRRLTGDIAFDVDDLERIAAILDIDVVDLMPQREGRLITVGGTSRPTRGDLTTAISPLAERRGAHGPRSRVQAPVTARTGRIRPELIAA